MKYDDSKVSAKRVGWDKHNNPIFEIRIGRTKARISFDKALKLGEVFGFSI